MAKKKKEVPASKISKMRRFVLVRTKDVSGVSGEGVVAEGNEFSNGWVTLVWLSGLTSMTFFTSIKELDAIHGHDGSTQVVWLDSNDLE